MEVLSVFKCEKYKVFIQQKNVLERRKVEHFLFDPGMLLMDFKDDLNKDAFLD